jgi:hypothetical protein
MTRRWTGLKSSPSSSSGRSNIIVDRADFMGYYYILYYIYAFPLFFMNMNMTFPHERDMRLVTLRHDFELAAKYRDEIKGLREWLEEPGD